MWLVETRRKPTLMQLMGLGGKPEYRSALELLTVAEQGGIANAITARGLMLLREPANGEDWPIDLPEQQRFAEAVACFRQGLEHGDKLAALNLGYCLEHGIGIAADTEAALDSYLMAARQGEPAAQYRLSMLLPASAPSLILPWRAAALLSPCWSRASAILPVRRRRCLPLKSWRRECRHWPRI
ncbi:tetratricopeptide repeat protein [Shewanella algae]